ncbi:hypothetical protein [Lentzea sp. NPDC092896]|uniref:hypothetical protein n=1 Tax=Lentzea sp. NPDC092896 TaxID=3364127 RepID=UPI0037F86B3B
MSETSDGGSEAPEEQEEPPATDSGSEEPVDEDGGLEGAKIVSEGLLDGLKKGIAEKNTSQETEAFKREKGARLRRPRSDLRLPPRGDAAGATRSRDSGLAPRDASHDSG